MTSFALSLHGWWCILGKRKFTARAWEMANLQTLAARRRSEGHELHHYWVCDLVINFSEPSIHFNLKDFISRSCGPYPLCVHSF